VALHYQITNVTHDFCVNMLNIFFEQSNSIDFMLKYVRFDKLLEESIVGLKRELFVMKFVEDGLN
jgi:hypothetical protein